MTREWSLAFSNLGLLYKTSSWEIQRILLWLQNSWSGSSSECFSFSELFCRIVKMENKWALLQYRNKEHKMLKKLSNFWGIANSFVWFLKACYCFFYSSQHYMALDTEALYFVVLTCILGHSCEWDAWFWGELLWTLSKAFISVPLKAT